MTLAPALSVGAGHARPARVTPRFNATTEYLFVGAGHARPARQPTFEASMSSTPISTPK